MGNTIFSRPNTVIIEITCGSYSQIASSAGNYAKGLQFFHLTYRPCGCETKADTANYVLHLPEVIRIFEFMANNIVAESRYGTTFRKCL